MRFLLSSNPENLRTAISGYPSATVEAEYGDILVKGSVFTMAHHGPQAGQPCPCSYPNQDAMGIEVVGLSHVDLDTVGGCAALLGRKPTASDFWKLAEFIDLNGAHKLSQSGASEREIRALYAWWAWNEKHKVYPPHGGSCLLVTDFINTAIDVLELIINKRNEHDNFAAHYLKAGDAFKLEGEKLNADSFIEMVDDVILRVSPSFTNHLYITPTGEIAKVIVAYNTRNGSITVSFADTPSGEISARTIVQKLWGKQAGGHAGIAGSPRDRRMTMIDLHSTFLAIQRFIKES